jgi:hypothetical protein
MPHIIAAIFLVANEATMRSWRLKTSPAMLVVLVMFR